MDISFHPRDPEERRSVRAMVPLHRRVIAWLADFHKFVITLVSIAATTVAIHVWLKGLITRKEMDVAVEASVSKAVAAAFVDIRTDLAIIKTNTGGLPEWRGETTAKVIKLEEKVGVAITQADKANGRIDQYLVNARGAR
jgi:hypothetical protein